LYDTKTESLSNVQQVWCFMAGMAAGKYLAMLWTVPIAAALFFALSAVSRAVLPKVAAGLMASLDGDACVELHSRLVSCSFSVVSSVLMFVAWATGGFNNLHAASPVDSVVHATLSIWCGFCVWALWDGVRSRSSLRTSQAQSALGLNILALCAGVICLSKQLLGNKFSTVLCMLTCYSKYTRALIFENLWQWPTSVCPWSPKCTPSSGTSAPLLPSVCERV